MSKLENQNAMCGSDYSSEDAPTWPAPTVRAPAPTYPDDESTTVKTDGMSLAVALAALGLTAFVAGCSGSSLSEGVQKNDEHATTRTITGKLGIVWYGDTIDNPVVYAQSAEDERAYVATVAPDGSFALTLAADRTYQLAIANRGAGGRLTVISQVSWRAGSKIRWAKVSGGGEISIGTVRPVGVKTVATSNYGSNSGSGSGDESNESASSPSGSSGSAISSCSGSGSGSGASGSDGDSCYSDLPYDAKLPLGATYFLEQSFWEKGPSPAKIIKVEVEGGWRAAELASNTPFVVTQADCDHQGNKDKGRDRIFVTWQNFDGSTETDHLDMRYCLNEAWPPAQKTLPASCTAPKPAGGAASAPSPSTCEEEGGGSVCTGANATDSECDAPGDVYEPSESSACSEAAKKTDSPCAPKAPPAESDGPCGCVPENEACITTLDCAPGLGCFGSVCKPEL